MNDHQTIASHAQVVDRLARLRSILPLIATDLAAARRRANELETRNRQLSERVAELESKLTGSRHDKPGLASRSESQGAREAADAGTRPQRE
jgi:chromosome segregation ATPase